MVHPKEVVPNIHVEQLSGTSRQSDIDKSPQPFQETVSKRSAPSIILGWWESHLVCGPLQIVHSRPAQSHVRSQCQLRSYTPGTSPTPGPHDGTRGRHCPSQSSPTNDSYGRGAGVPGRQTRRICSLAPESEVSDTVPTRAPTPQSRPLKPKPHPDNAPAHPDVPHAGRRVCGCV